MSGSALLGVFDASNTSSSVEMLLAGLGLATFTISYAYGLATEHPLIIDPVSFVKDHIDNYGVN